MSIALTSNNLGISGSVGTVMLADTGSGSVQVTIVMSPGYTIKLQGGNVGFNTTASLNSGSIGSITISAGGHGPVYSVQDAKGQMLLSYVSREELRLRHPDLSHQLDSAIVTSSEVHDKSHWLNVK